MTSAQERKIKQTGCDARFDNLTRQLYATDASIYQIEPVGVAFPKSAEQASLVIRAAADAGLSLTPRGAGTSLVGNAIGEGLIVDFSRYNHQITELDLEKRSVRVGAGGEGRDGCALATRPNQALAGLRHRTISPRAE